MDLKSEAYFDDLLGQQEPQVGSLQGLILCIYTEGQYLRQYDRDIQATPVCCGAYRFNAGG